MAWFTLDTIDFFRELELNNNREWFERNKKRYEENVKKPMELFADEMIGRMRAVQPDITMSAKQAVFRIYKDIRFSKDKTPYKTNAGMHINAGGKGDLASPGLYFHIDPRKMGIASGCYMLEPATLKRLRAYLADNLDEFQRQLEDLEFKRRFGTIQGEKNKVLPTEFKEAAAKQPMLYNKQFYYWAEFEAESVLDEDLANLLMSHMQACQKMNAFLIKGC